MTEIIVALIGLVGAVISAFVIPYIRSKTTREQQDVIAFWVNAAVCAAEQVYRSVEKSGAMKKGYVMDFLKSKGLDVSGFDLDIMIEAAVRSFHERPLEMKKC